MTGTNDSIVLADVSSHRRNFDRVYRACEKDRFFYYPSLLRSPGKIRRIVLWGLRQSERDLAQYEPMIDAVLRRNPNIELLAVVGDHDSATYRLRGKHYVSQAFFFANPGLYRDATIVDRECTWQKEAFHREKLEALGFPVVRFEHFLMSPCMAPDGYLPEQSSAALGNYRQHSEVILEHRASLLSYVDWLADDKSKCVYLSCLMGLLSMDFRFFYHANLNPYEHRYVPGDVERPLTEDEIFVDCGAYDGADSINFARRVGFRFAAIHLFEPESNNFRLASDAISSFCADTGARRMYLNRLGVSEVNAYLRFEGTGTSVSVTSEMAECGRGVFVARLDDMLEGASWIKLEVEGAELAALKGAFRLVEQGRATVSVSTYHLPRDFLELLPYLRDHHPSHRLFLRHSGLEPGTLCITAVPAAA